MKTSQAFTPQFRKLADAVVSRYETKRASILEILRLLQEHHGHITLEMELEVAEYLNLPPIDVREVMTFYSLFYKAPKAKTRFHVCRTLACTLLGGKKIVQDLENRLGIKCGEQSKDGSVSLEAVECLGACELAPMMMKNDSEYIGNLTTEKLDELIKETRMNTKR